VWQSHLFYGQKRFEQISSKSLVAAEAAIGEFLCLGEYEFPDLELGSKAKVRRGEDRLERTHLKGKLVSFSPRNQEKVLLPISVSILR
jgi:hypothetical protein